MDWSSTDARLSSTLRSVFIAVLVVAYGWISRAPAASMTTGLLIAAGLQLAVVVIRRFASADEQPVALYIFELFADGVSVLLFALGVFGGIANISNQA